VRTSKKISSISVGFAGFVGLSLLVGCSADDSGDPDVFDRMGLFAGTPDAEGRFETRIWDMNDGTSRLTHHLVVDGEATETRVIFDEDSGELHNQLRDAIVAVNGTWEEDGVLYADQYEVVQPPPQHTIDPEKRDPRRIATILSFWTAQTSNNADARDRMFLADDSTNVFYRENSYGVEKVAGNVFGPYQIPDPGGCNPGLVKQSSDTAFIEKGHDPDDYIQFMYFSQGMQGCGWGGLATLGSPDSTARDSWYNGNFGCVVRNQEIGHNYGMRHSNSYGCVDEMGQPTVYSDNCETNEYGDNYDPMGGGCDHMNVMQKSYMGWLQGCNVTTITSSGTFNLVPTELPCNGIQALQIPSSTGQYFFLEYRTPVSFDAGDQGTLVHVGADIGFSQNPNILYGVSAQNDGFMRAGESFDDPAGTVTFTIVEEHPTHAVVQVDFLNGGDGAMPQCEDGAELTMEGGNWGTLECNEEPFPLDKNPPSVEITYPADGDIFPIGANFIITADASDDDGVTELTLYLDGEPLFSTFDPPWEWEVVNIPEGEYQFGVVAWDGPNNAASNNGEAITIVVTNDPPVQGTGSDDGTLDDSGGSDVAGDGTGGDGDTDTDTDPGLTTDDGSCACRSGRGSTAPIGGFALLMLGLLARRRRS
jgi:MYXO-CTERM domain-containing protein